MKRQFSSTRGARQSGNALIESALFFPVIIFMCFGVVDYSRLFALSEQAVSAAHAGTALAQFQPGNYTGSGDLSAAITAMETAATADVGTNGPAVHPTGSVFYSCANTDGTDGSYSSTMPTCANGVRIYVQVKTWIASNSVASYPAMVYPPKVFGISVRRVQ